MTVKPAEERGTFRERRARISGQIDALRDMNTVLQRDQDDDAANIELIDRTRDREEQARLLALAVTDLSTRYNNLMLFVETAMQEALDELALLDQETKLPLFDGMS